MSLIQHLSIAMTGTDFSWDSKNCPHKSRGMELNDSRNFTIMYYAGQTELTVLWPQAEEKNHSWPVTDQKLTWASPDSTGSLTELTSKQYEPNHHLTTQLQYNNT